MKTLTVVALLLAVIFVCEADAGSFNLSGFLDPGFSFGIGRGPSGRRGRERSEDADNEVERFDLPDPKDIKQFEVPKIFTSGLSNVDSDDDDDDDEYRNSGSRRRGRRN